MIDIPLPSKTKVDYSNVVFISIDQVAKLCEITVDKAKELHLKDLFFDEAITSSDLFTMESVNYYLAGKPAPRIALDKDSAFAAKYGKDARQKAERAKENRAFDALLVEAYQAKKRLIDLKTKFDRDE